jgi:hypothetical protein
MKGDTVTSTQLTELISGIRQINGVQLVTELNSEQIRNKKNLIF